MFFLLSAFFKFLHFLHMHHNFWTNYNIHPFSTSKWLSELQFCWRYHTFGKKLQKIVIKQTFRHIANFAQQSLLGRDRSSQDLYTTICSKHNTLLLRICHKKYSCKKVVLVRNNGGENFSKAQKRYSSVHISLFSKILKKHDP